MLAELDDADGVAEAVEHLALGSSARGELEIVRPPPVRRPAGPGRAPGAPLREIDARRVNEASRARCAPRCPLETLQSLEAEAAALDEGAAAALALSTVTVAGSAT